MALVKGVAVLPALGTLTSVSIDTNITADSKSGWEITGFKAHLRSRDATGIEYLEAMVIDAKLATVATVTLPDSDDEIARVTWGLAWSSAASFTPIPIIQRADMTESRLTVQPLIYVNVVNTVGIVAITDIYYEFSYDVVKLTDVELLRLLIGGA